MESAEAIRKKMTELVESDEAFKELESVVQGEKKIGDVIISLSDRREFLLVMGVISVTNSKKISSKSCESKIKLLDGILFRDPQQPSVNAGGGLINIGNTCFANAALQVLFHLRPFVEAINRIEHEQESYGDHLERIIEETQNNRETDITDFVEKVANDREFSADAFIIGHQQDAVIFMDKLLQTMSEEVKDVFRVPVTPFHEFTVFFGLGDLEEEPNFGAMIQNKILEHNPHFNEPPPCVLIAPYRLDHVPGQRQVIYLNHRYPVEMSMNIFAIDYSLSGIIVFYGTDQAGHYVTFARSLEDGRFYEFNDSQVSEKVELNVAKLSESYCLAAYIRSDNAQAQNEVNQLKVSKKGQKLAAKVEKRERQRVTRQFNPDRVKKENLERAERLRIQRDNSEEFRESDNTRRRKEIAEKRQDPKFQIADNERRRTALADRRKDDPDFLLSDKERCKIEMAKRRDDPQFSLSDKMRRKKTLAEKRKDDPEFLKSDRDRRKTAITEKRKDQDFHDEEKKKKAERRLAEKTIRENQKRLYKEKNNSITLIYNEQMKERLKKSKSKEDKEYLKIAAMMNEQMNATCSCCERLIFPSLGFKKIYTYQMYTTFKNKRIDVVSEVEYKKNLGVSKEMQEFYLCGTCYRNNLDGTMTVYGRLHGIKNRIIPTAVTNLTDLEERFTSPVIPFMQIRPMKNYSSSTYHGCKGSVINIKIDTHEMRTALPRNFNDVSVIQIMLKRHMAHKSYYKYETVSVSRINKALEYLKSTPLYRFIEIKDNLLEQHQHLSIGKDLLNFVIDEKDAQKMDLQNEEEDLSDDEEIIDRVKEAADILVYNLPLDATLEDLDNNQAMNDLQIEVNNKFKTIIIAPGQDKKPTSAQDIEFYEEVSFPSIYGGYPLNYNRDLISMNKRYKFQLANKDRRYAATKHLFLMAKNSLRAKLVSAINVAMRQQKDRKVTVRDVLSTHNVNLMCEDNMAYRFLRQITLSPSYLEHKRKDVMAYFRQKGHPQLFLTLSPAEFYWAPLLQQLYQLKNGKTISAEDALNLSENEKHELILSDPSLCTTYFHRRKNIIFNLIRQKYNKVFGEHYVVDYYQRIEYQQRGFSHAHTMLYCNKLNVDKLKGKEKEAVLIAFADSCITTEYDLKNPHVIHQVHICTSSCYKGRYLKICRYGFPKYPTPRTVILHPFKEDEITDQECKIIEANLKKVQDLLLAYRKELRNFFLQRRRGEIGDDYVDNFDSFDQMLEKLKMTEKNYYDCLRADIKSITIFYKRAPNAVEINNYNRYILDIWQANMDLQLVLDPYAAACYLFSYVLKSEPTVVRMLNESVKESKDIGLKQFDTLKKVANAFQNVLLISAPQAADFILGHHACEGSRSCVFINTGAKEKRVHILKQKAVLKQMNLSDDDIFELGILEHYSTRPKQYDYVTLADFASKFNMSFQNGNMQLKQRTVDHERIIRFVQYNKMKEPKEYMRVMIMLYHPWRDEEIDLIEKSLDDLKQILESNKDSIEKQYSYYNKISPEVLAEFMERMKEEPEREDEDELIRRLNREKVEEFDEEFITSKDGKGAKKRDIQYKINLPPRVTDDEIEKSLLMLNEQQRQLVYEIYWRFIKQDTNHMTLLFGSAGTGKSFVIRALYNLITSYLDKIPGNADNKDKPRVLLAASTGIAAFLIGGTTYHTAFKFPIDSTATLSENVTNTIRKEIRHVEMVIIDEVSMMSYGDLRILDERMQKIFNNSKPFGGKYIVLVGDLFQLPPVGRKPIYHQYSANEDNATLHNLRRDLLWSNFKMFTLTQIMRQKNDKFIHALRALNYGRISNEQLKFLRQRECSEENVPVEAVRLFAKNEDVMAFNNKRVNDKKLAGMVIEVGSSDVVFDKLLPNNQKEEILKKFLNDSKVDIKIPKLLKLRENIKYMIPVNIDIQDGLVNGAVGVLRHITYDKNGDVQIVWLQYQNKKVGAIRRMQPNFKTIASRDKIPNDMVPIVKEAVDLMLTNEEGQKLSSKNKITRRQFPLYMAEALTIHKSQGQTLAQGVCLDLRGMKKALSLPMLFVALSRCDYENLFILGTITIPSILTKSDIDRILEFDRLEKDSLLQLSFDTLNELKEGFTIIYQNINSFNKKSQHILADPWYANGDVLIFSEANVDFIRDRKQIPANLHVIFPTIEDNYQSKRNRGLLIMAKDRNIRKVLSPLDIKEDSNNSHIDLRSFIIGSHFIITGYKSPKISNEMFKKCLEKILQNAPKDMSITLIGDFNFNVRDQAEEFRKKILDIKLPHNLTPQNFHTQLGSNEITFQGGSQIDVIFSTSNDGYGGAYPTYFSDHYSIFYRSTKKLKVKEADEEKKKHDEYIKKLRIEKNRLEAKEKLKKEKLQAKKVRKSKRIAKRQRQVDSNTSGESNESIKHSDKLTKKDEVTPEKDAEKFIDMTEESHDYMLDFTNKIHVSGFSHNDVRGEFSFFYMCAFNSTIHGYLWMYRNDVNFREFVKNGMESKLSPLIISLLDQNQIQKDKLWLNFLMKNYDGALQINLNGFCSYFVDMATNVLDIYGPQRSLLSDDYSSYIDHRQCSSCGDVYVISNQTISLPGVGENCFEDFASTIITSITSGVINCSNCNVAYTSNVIFNQMVVITLDAGGEQLDLEIPMSQIPEEISLPMQSNVSADHHFKIFKFQYLQNLFSLNDRSNLDVEARAQRLHHYSAVCNFENCYHEFDDLVSKTRCVKQDRRVNPTALIYMECTESELSKCLVFHDSLVGVRSLNKEVMLTQNMSAYNSIVHGFLCLFRNNKQFQYIISSSKNVPFFNLLPQLLDQRTKDSTWLNYLYDCSQISYNIQNSNETINDLQLIAEYIFHQFSSFKKICTVHNHQRDSHSSFSNVSIYIRSKNKVDFEALISHTIAETKPQGDCNSTCRAHRTELAELLVVTVSGFDFLQNEQNQPEMTVSNLPNIINVQDQRFKLIFVVHKKFGLTNESQYITQYMIGIHHHIEINKQSVALKHNRKATNPKLMIFLRTSNSQIKKQHVKTSSAKSNVEPADSTIVLSSSIKQRSKIFDNTFEAQVIMSENEFALSMTVWNMCRVNSFLHGIFFAYSTNEKFRRVVIQCFNDKFIKLMDSIEKSRNEKQRNHHWLQYLYNIQYFTLFVKRGDMHGNFQEAIEALIHPYLSHSRICTNCNEQRLIGEGRPDGSNLLVVNIRNKRRSIDEFIREELAALTRIVRNCSNCNQMAVKTSFGDIILATVCGDSYGTDTITKKPELTYDDLPNHITVNGNHFDLIFAVHHIPSLSIGHFVTQYRIGKDSVLHIDDISGVYERDPSALINPVLLVFAKMK